VRDTRPGTVSTAIRRRRRRRCLCEEVSLTCRFVLHLCECV